MKNFLFTKEAIFAFYLVSGDIKIIYPLLHINGIPDITLLSALFLAIIMLHDLPYSLRNISIKKLEFIIIFILIYLFSIFSLAYTSSDSYSLTKVINFGTVILGFFFPLLTKEFNRDFFIYSLTVLIFFISIVFLDFYISYLNKDSIIFVSMSHEEALKLTIGYLSVSVANGILIIYYFFKKNQISWIQWSIVLIAMIFLVASGGRGPLLVVVLVLGSYFTYQLVMSLINFQIKKLIIPIIILSAIIGSLIIAISTKSIESNNNKAIKLFESSLERFQTLKNSEGGGKSAYSRILYTKFAIDKINQQPLLGYGIGSFGFEYNNIDEKDYPHNLFLEVWFEMGVIPLFLLILFFYAVYAHISSVECYWCIAIYFYFFFNILKSDSLTDIRTLISFFSIFLLIKRETETKLISKSK